MLCNRKDIWDRWHLRVFLNRSFVRWDEKKKRKEKEIEGVDSDTDTIVIVIAGARTFINRDVRH